ncbi:MAG: GGDEF domain-containing protein, partial [Gammaproteobacteria bacterium]|nr:GGDEF domain-containing protein [Gammaproteobacteria bacterium]
EYREKLEYANTKLNDEMDLNVLRDVVSEMIAETRRMQESSKQLQLHLNATCDELDTLRSDFQKVQNEIFNDPLTGILNRRGLSKLLEQMKLNEAEQDSVSVLMIDIDNFKQFNDSFGHIIGDEVIKFVTNTITDNLKGRDITVRFGGEEFLVILPDTALNMAERVALKLCHAMKAAPLTQTSTRRKLGHITISIGVTSNHHKEQMENIIERADSALYEAKKSGRDRVFSFPLAGDISHEVA